MSKRAPCICDWPEGCGGSGVLMCDGCGGDTCVCVCGGEAECYGCAECNHGAEDFYDGDPEPKGASHD